MAGALAWSGVALFAAITLATLGLVLWGAADPFQLTVVLASGYAVVGALVARRQPANPVGWLLLGTAVAFAVQGCLDAYLDRHRPGEVAVAWLSSWAWLVWIMLAGMVLPLVFPTGRLLDRRWRPAIGLALAWLALAVLTTGLHPGVLEASTLRPVENPLAAPAASRGVLEVAEHVVAPLSALGYLLAAAALAIRLRRSRGRERAQVKTFAFVGVLAVTALLVAVGAEIAGDDSDRWVYVVGATGWFAALLLIVVGLPVAVGAAILRHRLYDVDLVIKRTLVYGSLSAALVATYLTSVLVLRLVLAPVTGESDLAVAASTLAVAGLFRPLRWRIQRWWTGGSSGRGTTRRAPWRGSRPGCVTSSTSRRWAAISGSWCATRWRRRGCRCGCGRRADEPPRAVVAPVRDVLSPPAGSELCCWRRCRPRRWSARVTRWSCR